MSSRTTGMVKLRPDTEYAKRMEAKRRRNRAEIARVAVQVEKLLRDGMQPHAIIAAFRARRRMRLYPPGYVPDLIGYLPLVPRAVLLPPAMPGDAVEPIECTMLDVRRGDGDE